ncbi:hypothetical protein GRI62_09280 [Erythrobacter arachoides]|uniref:Lipoprotein n=1 Tax=Aurantiacibacter arachoides TaxID=1850444 RepID=A0A845A1K2_9SPHN|nr:hypothetical protein [Aurantiacibacter arachoides]MXO93798.1 hypothetical protein [Aurantiacibacter arachoides]GGD46589.1 hypothetical protein GCM10011411_02840 [Aurantiacibacter arachoides]
MTRPLPRFALALVALAAVAACQQEASEPLPAPEPSRLSLDDVRVHEGTATPSPDTSQARWRVAADGQGIDFGNAGAPPWLSLECALDARPAELVIVRHAETYPGQSALFPFVGNGMRSRFFADAVLHDGEWRWEARLPAEDPQTEVFEGTRDFTATLPGHGMLEIRGSRMPGEFVEWCRSGGQARLPTPEPSPTAEPSPAPTASAAPAR